jgi:FemAB-related protein (PEP-CTERM system-associated)
MKIEVFSIDNVPKKDWDDFVSARPNAHLYHCRRWAEVIQETYGHPSFFLICRGPARDVQGILLIVRLKSLVFGDRLVSLPFFDLGGVLASSIEAERLLVRRSDQLRSSLNIPDVELRRGDPIPRSDGAPLVGNLQERSLKVRMILSLPDSADSLMKSFKSKLRSQIRRPMKEGLYSRIGSLELLDDFYFVFAKNMRDLGSPVHSRGLIVNVIRHFPDKTRIVVIYDASGAPTACSLIIGFRSTLYNPWASALREYSRLSPNMLLYWSMLSFGCDNGYKFFDFGRSTPGEGTYRFKKQWGASPIPLHWYGFGKKGGGGSVDTRGYDSGKFDMAIRMWKKLPVGWSRFLGPLIRRHVDL